MGRFFAKKNIPPTAYAGSGSSGRLTFWFMGGRQEAVGGKAHEIIFKEIFGIKKNDSTLVVNCFAMGLWIAGNYTQAACRYLAKKGYRITTISPGIEKKDIFIILRDLAPQFKKLILTGYPPFLMDVIREARGKNMPLRKDIKILTAGNKIS